jgi:predicted ATPase
MERWLRAIANRMIKRISIENYRCFENAVLEPSSLSLLLGSNGVGKSTVFEILFKVRQLVTGSSDAPELFPSTTQTRWGAQKIQIFGLDFEGPDGDYQYHLSISQRRGSAIAHEEIRYDGQLLYSFGKEQVTLYEEGKILDVFPAGSRVSPLSNLPSKLLSPELEWLIDRIVRIWVFNPIPQSMAATARREQGGFLRPDLSNFVSWFLSMQKSRPALERKLKRSLREVLDGFRDYRFVRFGGGLHALQFRFASPHNRRQLIDFSFSELSEGQRALVVLYTLLHALAGEASTICLDEPENYLSPREIQPTFRTSRS